MMLVLYGPTSSGKTDLAVRLAKKFNGELISADSRQVYKGLDVGTGKVSFESKVEKHPKYWVVEGVRINGFDLANPGKQFTVADFLKFAQASINRIEKAGKLPIVVGGTGFYIKALLDGIESMGIPLNSKLRRKLKKLSIDQLYHQLLVLDKKRAKSMNESDRQNPRRLIRAIEIAMRPQKKTVTNYPLSTTHYRLIGLTAPNAYLFKKADQAFQNRITHGMVQEIKSLLAKGVNPKWLESLGLEYRWLTRYILGKVPQKEAFERSKGDLHSFIRRQKTWSKKFKNIYLFNTTRSNWQSQLEKIVKFWYTQKSDGIKSSN